MTKSQIFKSDPSFNYFHSFIQKHLYYDIESNEYISNINTFKKLKLYDNLDAFITYIKPYYFDSKINYPLNANTTKGFHVVLRQLCKYFKITYRYKIQYFHSKYDIVYYIKLP